jgi:hypothetical protein
MDEKTLNKLLHEPKEKDWFDFKSTLKLYQSDGKLVEKQRDELLKDILGLANGNSFITRETKYFIVGADDIKFDETGMRVLHDVDYKVPERSELVKRLSSASSPAIVGLECELVPFQGANLWVIIIPPTFDLHETTRELMTPSGKFNKNTVFMRQDEHTVPASVRDGVTIQQRKQLFRQEIANPASWWVGTIVGGIVGFIIGGAKIREAQITPPISDSFVQSFFVILGVFFGVSIGWMVRQLNEIRYDWRYLTLKKRIAFIVVIFVMLGIYYFLFR